MPEFPIAADCLEHFRLLKFEKKYRYLILRVENEKEVVLEKAAELPDEIKSKSSAEKREYTYNELCKSLPKNECRYVVVDGDSCLFFVLWSPDTAQCRARGMYSSHKESTQQKFPGCSGNNIETHDEDDLSRLK